MVAFQPAVLTEHAMHGRGCHGHDIPIEHPEGQPPVALQRMFVMEAEDRGDLGVGESPIARDFSVVLVDAAVSLLRVVELVLPNAEPGDVSLDGNVRSPGPLGDVVHDFVARVVGNPNSG